MDFRQMLLVSAPWWGNFLCALLLGLVFVPICRKVAIVLGMVDKPSARRINKMPIPRAGGFGIFLAVTITLLLYFYLAVPTSTDVMLFKITAAKKVLVLSSVLCVVGLIDDKRGLKPLIKLGGQFVVAVLTWAWVGASLKSISVLNFLPMPIDCFLTVFWIVGAINAFNLIDGLDGLATGLALIAAIGMLVVLLFIGYANDAIFYCAFAGGCLAFLRYNFHPASVFLGDTGSMYLGFVLSVLPLLTKSGDSLFAAIGVPLLAMGVPIFDTSLAIIRRSTRAVLKYEERDEKAAQQEGNSRVMQPDTDHLHHRILRQFVSQRKAAMVLYMLSLFFVLVGIGGVMLRDRAAGLFIVAFIAAVYIIVRDMRRVEIWDAARLADILVHDKSHSHRRRRRILAVPLRIISDIAGLMLSWLITSALMNLDVNSQVLHTWFILRIVPAFLSLVVFRIYSVVWSRALLSNFVRLFVALVVAMCFSTLIAYFFDVSSQRFNVFSIINLCVSFILLSALRVVRNIVRDFFYAIVSGTLADSKDVERILVYGAGLRYRSFRRELVRSSARSKRVIVGLIDDDILLRGMLIGGIKIYGSLREAPQIISNLKIDCVVVACDITPQRLEVVKKTVEHAGVRLIHWHCTEEVIYER